MMKRFLCIFLMLTVLFILGFGISGLDDSTEAPMSEQTEECLECHTVYTPGIVRDWLSSEHSRTVPAESLKKPDLERVISSQSVPEQLLGVTVGCYECHGRNPEKHKDNFEHGKKVWPINPTPSMKRSNRNGLNSGSSTLTRFATLRP